MRVKRWKGESKVGQEGERGTAYTFLVARAYFRTPATRTWTLKREPISLCITVNQQIFEQQYSYILSHAIKWKILCLRTVTQGVRSHLHKRSASDFTTAYHSYEQLHVKYFNINSAIIHIRLQFRLIYSPGQLFALCFTSENKITGLLLVTYKYRGEIVVKLKENKRKKRIFDFLIRYYGFESRREIVFSCCCWWFFSLFCFVFFVLSTLIVLVPRETVLFENVWNIEIWKLTSFSRD